MKKLNERLKEIRGTRSVQAMASLAGTTRQSWYCYEKNYPEIPHQTAIRLAEAEGLTLDWIYRGIKND